MQFLSTSLLALGALSGLASAQYQIRPDSVPLSLRQYWCDSQITQCPLICLQYPDSTGAVANDCDASNLSYECVCSTGISPNSSEFSQTLPYFVCSEWGNQCVTACAGSNTCADSCRTDHPCGARNPTRVNSTTSSTMEATATAQQTFGAFSQTPTGMASARYSTPYSALGNKFGFIVGAVGFVGGFAFFL